MLKKLNDLKNRRSQGGFTIIEVMIVLAIAGLILLIVFLAVPALQRTARNTQRKNDAAAVSSAIANFISDNGGSLPTALGYSTSDTTSMILYCSGAPVTVGGAAITGIATSTYASNCTTTNTNSETAKLGYYKLGAAAQDFFFANAGTGFTANTSGSTPSATTVTTESMTIDLGYGCNSTNTGPSSTPSTRSAAILYATETSGGANLQCVEQ